MSKKNTSVELLRIIASLAVVMLHVMFMSYLQFPESSNINYERVYNVLCFCVPVFVMITGFLTLNPKKKFNLEKSIKKVLKPLLVYGLIFSCLEYFFEFRTIGVGMFFFAIKALITQNTWAHMWYLYMILGLYCIVPFLKILVNNMSVKKGTLLIGLLIISDSVIPAIEQYFGLRIGFTIPLSGIYVAYFLLGYYLPLLNISGIGLIIGLVFSCIMAAISPKLGYSSLFVVIISVCIFKLALQNQRRIEEKWNNVFSIIAKNTFGIYVLHMIFVNVIYKVLRINPYNYNEYIIWILLTIIVYILAFFTTLIINKIPYMNKIFGL